MINQTILMTLWQVCLHFCSSQFVFFWKIKETRWNSTGFRRRLCLRLWWPWRLTFDFLTYSVSLRLNYMCDPISVKLAQIFTKILYSHVFEVIAYCHIDFWPLIPKSHHYERNTSVTEIGWNSFRWFWDRVFALGFRVITCCDLDLWLFDLISMSEAQVHSWPNFGEISSNIYEDIVFTLFFGSLPAVTLTFDLLAPKFN